MGAAGLWGWGWGGGKREGSGSERALEEVGRSASAALLLRAASSMEHVPKRGSVSHAPAPA